MKKTLSIVLTICLCLSFGLLFTSCDHEHTYKTEWSKNAIQHWHICEVEGCLIVADKADHVWDDGTVANGEKTSTCTVCGATKTEADTFAGITEDEWNAMIAAPNFDNYTLMQTQTAESGGITQQQKILYKMDGDVVYSEVTIDQTPTVTFLYTDDAAVAQKQLYETLIFAIIANFDNFTYDSATESYKTTADIPVDMTVDYYGISLQFVFHGADLTLNAEGRLLTLVSHCTQTQTLDGTTVNVEADISWEFSDYGTTVVDTTAQ